MRWTVIVLVVGATGCNAILGIDDFASFDAMPPPTPTTITHAKLVVEPLRRTTVPVIGEVLTILDANGESSTATTDDRGVATTSADVSSIVLPADPPYQFDTAADVIAMDSVAFGHPAPRPVLPGSVKIKGARNGEQIYLASTGIYTFTAPSVPGNTTYELDWASAVPIGGGPLGLLETGDTLRVLAFTSVTDPNNVQYAAVTKLAERAGSFDPNTEIAMPSLAPVLRDRCVHVITDRRVAHDRLGDVDAFTATNQWAVQAIADSDVGVVGMLPIAEKSQSGRPLVADDARPVFGAIGNGALFLTLNAYGRKTSTLDSVSVTTTRYVVKIQEIATGTIANCPDVTIDPAVAMASAPAVAGIAIDRERHVTVPRTGRVPIEWNLSFDGAVDDYLVVVYEVSDGRTAAKYRVRTTARRVDVPASAFVAGGYYYIEILTETGNPGIAGGHLGTIGYPYASSVNTSPVFAVD